MIVGVVGDLHEPFTHEGYFRFIRKVFYEWQVQRVIFIGDIVDNHAISYHESDPDGLSAGDELAVVRGRLSKWEKEFPYAIVTLGNHDKLPERKLFSMGIPRGSLREYGDLYGVPSWKFVPEVYFEEVRYLHGVGSSGVNGARNLALKSRCSVVMGHGHSYGGVQYLAGPRDTVFGLNVGCGVDVEAYAMAYGREFPLKPTLGCGIVVDGKEGYFVPYKEV